MSKYGNVRTELGGITFDSKREAARWADLSLLERLGKIRDLRRQVTFVLIPSCEGPDGKRLRAVKYIADFTYRDQRGFHVEDAKGVRTDVYRLKKRLMWHVHQIDIEEV